MWLLFHVVPGFSANKTVAALDGRFLGQQPVNRHSPYRVPSNNNHMLQSQWERLFSHFSVFLCVSANVQVNREAEDWGGEGCKNPGGCDVRGGCVCVCGVGESSPHAGRPGLSGLDHMCLVQKKQSS